MNKTYIKQPTRRRFLQTSVQFAVAGAATPLALSLGAIADAAAMSAIDYKALVCVFLYGGNDYANTVVRVDDRGYAEYARVRGAGSNGLLQLPLAHLEPTLLSPVVASASEARFALAPQMAGMADLFHQGRMAVQLNVGPLVMPLTRKQFHARALPQPPKLFSHNDQQSVWQAQGAEGAIRGWGGRMADIALSTNGDPMFTCISVSGNAVFLSGQQAVQYQCSKHGAVAVEAIRGNAWGHFLAEPSMRAAFERMIHLQHSHVLANEYNKVMQRSLSGEERVRSALSSSTLGTMFPSGNSLAEQLKTVARLIGGRASLGAKRQVFMVSLDGFDVHDGMSMRQPLLLSRLSEALTAFDSALIELGVSDQVTTFTASDFGRTLSVNGDGTDHGWGSHQFVLGGAVKGRQFYGAAPPISIGNTDAPEDQWHVGQGRLLPSTSVDQFAATLAKWFGLSELDLYNLLPNLQNFGIRAGRPDYPVDLGFMKV